MLFAKHHAQYHDVLSVIRPIPHGQDILVPEPDVNMEYRSDSEHRDMTVVAGDDASKPEEEDQPVTLIQAGLSD